MLSLLGAIGLGSCVDSEEDIPNEPILEIALNKSSVTMGVSDTDTLSVTTDIGILAVDWMSSDPSIVSITEHGIIEALDYGSAEISAIVDTLTATCLVEVKPTSINLNESEITLKVTDVDTLSILTDIGDLDISWVSSDPEIVAVDERGRLVALNSGSANIVASVGDLSVACAVTVDVTVFLGGYYNDYDAAYWKDGVMHPLTYDSLEEGYFSYVNSIKVVNGNIFAGGQKQEVYNTIWKNGEETFLELTGWANELMELAAWDDGVLAVGGRDRIYLWNETDGISYWSGENEKASGTSIFVDNSDIYIGGMQNVGGINRASIWKNQQAFTLDYTIYHIVKDIYVENGDFYTCATEYIGTGQVKSKYWKNETLVELTDGTYNSSVSSILVMDGDVYVGGQKRDKPVVWKNGEEIFYEDASVKGIIQELVAHGNDLYAVGNVRVAGNYVYSGVVWKNGEEIFRTELFDDAYLYCIDVK